MMYHQAHQQRCPVRGVTTFQSFGGFYMPVETIELTEKYPTIFQVNVLFLMLGVWFLS